MQEDHISIHAPLAGSDSCHAPTARAGINFNPRSPRGERRLNNFRKLPNVGDFNPRSPRGERPPFAIGYLLISRFQSTLPSRGATEKGYSRLLEQEISIHAPLAGSDILRGSIGARSSRFQSTLPSRGATMLKCYQIADTIFQSTLPSRGATRQKELYDAVRQFQSTLPSRGATSVMPYTTALRPISIHAPLAGSDRFLCGYFGALCYFNPRSPRGERLMIILGIFCLKKFQSTLPSRGATLLKPVVM